MTTRCRKWTPVLFLGMASGFNSQAADYSTRPPFSADQLWRKIEVLLNKQHGSVTRELFESVMGVKLGEPRNESDATIYLLHAGHDWYFDARLTVYNEKFRSQGAENAAHSEWTIVWRPDSFGPEKDSCLRAERVRASLMAQGWTSPWGPWGAWEKPPAGTPYQGPNPPLRPQPQASFGLQTDADAGRLGNVLPRGRIFTTGDLPDSCVTGIRVTAQT